jgi:hypothetical protein
MTRLTHIAIASLIGIGAILIIASAVSIAGQIVVIAGRHL